jgi:hypothetical protein
VIVWASCALALPRLVHQAPSAEAVTLYAGAGVAGLLVVGAVFLTVRFRPSAHHEAHHAVAPLSLETQSAQRPG